MAIPNYIKFNPVTDTGNKQVTVTQEAAHTGRIVRSTTVKGKLVGKSDSVTVIVDEQAKPEFITPEGSPINVSNDGETIHLRGKSNSPKLTFAITGDTIGLTTITTYKVNTTINATSGTNISGDPGAIAEFEYDVTIVIPANGTTGTRQATITITGSTGTVTSNVVISQAEGEAYLYVNQTGQTSITLTIPQAGTAQTFNVLSNDEWVFGE